MPGQNLGKTRGQAGSEQHLQPEGPTWGGDEGVHAPGTPYEVRPPLRPAQELGREVQEEGESLHQHPTQGHGAACAGPQEAGPPGSWWA